MHPKFQGPSPKLLKDTLTIFPVRFLRKLTHGHPEVLSTSLPRKQKRKLSSTRQCYLWRWPYPYPYHKAVQMAVLIHDQHSQQLPRWWRFSHRIQESYCSPSSWKGESLPWWVKELPPNVKFTIYFQNLDLSAAFDTIVHSVLLKMLANRFRIIRTPLRWVKL